MAHYRVLVNGVNFWLLVEDTPKRMGFFTTRFVEAASPEEAELAAVDLLRAERKLKPLNERSDPPRVFVEGIEEVLAADIPAVLPGFTFFPDDGETDA